MKKRLKTKKNMPDSTTAPQSPIWQEETPPQSPASSQEVMIVDDDDSRMEAEDCPNQMSRMKYKQTPKRFNFPRSPWYDPAENDSDDKLENQI